MGENVTMGEIYLMSGKQDQVRLNYDWPMSDKHEQQTRGDHPINALLQACNAMMERRSHVTNRSNKSASVGVQCKLFDENVCYLFNNL